MAAIVATRNTRTKHGYLIARPATATIADMATLITAARVAERLACSRTMVRQLILSGELVAVRVGRDFRVDEASLEAYLERQTIRPAEAPA